MWINRFITELEFRRYVSNYVLFIGISPRLSSTWGTYIHYHILPGHVNTGTSLRDMATTYGQWQTERWLREDKDTSSDTNQALSYFRAKHSAKQCESRHGASSSKQWLLLAHLLYSLLK